MNNLLVIVVSLAYLGLLFTIAYISERKLFFKKSLINNGYVYALSLAVYCTAWTYYGSVGRASEKGMDFLTIYLGPTLASILFWPLLFKMIRISRTQRITSIADFISSRYGKNLMISGLVSVLCVIGIIPYISLQLKAITSSIRVITQQVGPEPGLFQFWNDHTFYIAIVLTLFIFLFGTRSVDATEKHEGLVAAVAFESLVKLLAFLAVGIFVVYGVFNGFGDIFSQAAQREDLSRLLSISNSTNYISWFGLMMVSFFAIFLLPRQFQVSVVENVSEEHISKATWLFPLYLLLINIFVLPIALGGKIIFSGLGVDSDTYVLQFPLMHHESFLGLLVYLGGFSAATSMIIIETIALSTMLSNNLILPIWVRSKTHNSPAENISGKSIISIRRFAIVIIIIMSYWYDKVVAQHFQLVSLGLVSFVAVAQFAPSIFGGMYWKSASKNGALAGMIAGFVIWFYTLVIPTLVSAGVLPERIIENGPLGIELLKPFALMGIKIDDHIVHAAFWSLVVNVSLFIFISLRSRLSAQEVYQAELFVDALELKDDVRNRPVWKGTAYIPDLKILLSNFLGEERANRLIQNFASRNKMNPNELHADPRMVEFCERVLSGIIGAASARILMGSITNEEELKSEELLGILRESQQMIELNKMLKKQSLELEKTGKQLGLINLQLQDMDRNKDEFLYTVTHELRTPLTSIRALSEIVHDNPDMDPAQKQQFLSSIIRETERLTRLISQVLNLERFESGKHKLQLSSVNLNQLLVDSVESVQALAQEKKIKIQLMIPDASHLARCDEDLILQVMSNLLSNAIKFSYDSSTVEVELMVDYDEYVISVQDHGRGIEESMHLSVFDKFIQAKNQTLRKPEGSGLGLAICKKIVELHEGKIWLQSKVGIGSKFLFTLPVEK